MILLKYDCIKADKAGIMISAIEELRLLNIEVIESEYKPESEAIFLQVESLNGAVLPDYITTIEVEE